MKIVSKFIELKLYIEDEISYMTAHEFIGVVFSIAAVCFVVMSLACMLITALL